MFTFDADVVSDLHKDTYGIRPSSSFWLAWDEASDPRKQEIWDDLIEQHDYEMEREREEQVRAKEFFEQEIVRAMSFGCQTREDAIRWVAEAWLPLHYEGYSAYYRAEGLCFVMNLPFSMAMEIAGCLPEEF